MPKNAFRAAAPFILLLTSSAFVSSARAAQGPERRPAPSTTQAPISRELIPRDIDANNTRRDLIEVLKRHPPSVARVLKLDPSLMQNENYLASYPTLKEFLAQHPDIQQNSDYYLENVYGVENRDPPNRRMDLVEGTLAGLAGFTAFIIALSTVIWLVRTGMEQRRWNRLSKIQAEVHSKLMDRFSSNDELLTYVQTPSGRRFLESGPSPLQEAAPRTIGAPFARILWSVQLGVVLLVAGVGLLYVSTRTFEEMKEFFFIFGTLAMALGAGFTVSAAAAYALSRKLGLFDPPAANHA